MYSRWAIHFRGRYIYCFICFLFHCLLIYIHDVIHLYMSLFLCFVKSRIYFVYLYFPHMHLYILFSVSEKIQVDSIELLSTLATNG